MVPILDLTFASVSDSRYTGLKNQFELKFLDTTEVMVSFIHYYTGVSVSELRWGSRYPNKTGVSVSEFFVFLFGYRDPWAKKSC